MQLVEFVTESTLGAFKGRLLLCEGQAFLHLADNDQRLQNLVFGLPVAAGEEPLCQAVMHCPELEEEAENVMIAMTRLLSAKTGLIVFLSLSLPRLRSDELTQVLSALKPQALALIAEAVQSR